MKLAMTSGITWTFSPFPFPVVVIISRVSFREGAGEHLPLLGFGLPPLGNFDLKVNQFKCFEIFNSCTMHNKC